MTSNTEEHWAIFQAAPHNKEAGRVGPTYPSKSAAIINFMKIYDISKEEWERGVEQKKYDCRMVAE